MKLHEIKNRPLNEETDDLRRDENGFLLDDWDITAWLVKATVGDIGTIDIDEKGFVTSEHGVRIVRIPEGDGKLKVRFKRVKGDFKIHDAGLITLDGCPAKVEGNFDCSNNPKLKSLEGGPDETTNDYLAHGCSLESFDSLPYRVNKDFVLNNNKLKNFKCEHDVEIGRCLFLHHNEFTNFDGIEDCVKFYPGGWSLSGEISIDDSFKHGSLLHCILVHGATKLIAAELPVSSYRDPSLIKAVFIVNTFMGKPHEIFDCQSALIDAGLEKFT